MLEEIKSLKLQLESLSHYTAHNAIELKQIFRSFKKIVSDLYDENPNKWYGVWNGLVHTENEHIQNLDNETHMWKVDGYTNGRYQLKGDLEEVFDELSDES